MSLEPGIATTRSAAWGKAYKQAIRMHAEESQTETTTKTTYRDVLLQHLNIQAKTAELLSSQGWMNFDDLHKFGTNIARLAAIAEQVTSPVCEGAQEYQMEEKKHQAFITQFRYAEH